MPRARRPPAERLRKTPGRDTNPRCPFPESYAINPDLFNRQRAHAIAQRPKGSAAVAFSGNAYVVGC